LAEPTAGRCSRKPASTASAQGDLTEEELAKIIGLIDKGFWSKRRAARSSRTSPAGATSAAIAAIVIAARFPSAAKRTCSNARTRKGPRKTVAGKQGREGTR
jgi:small subunit ribosomal protein S13